MGGDQFDQFDSVIDLINLVANAPQTLMGITKQQVVQYPAFERNMLFLAGDTCTRKRARSCTHARAHAYANTCADGEKQDMNSTFG